MHDDAIIRLFLSRDERAITEVKTEYGAACERAARNILGDASAAEEAVSDMLLALWRSIPPEKPRSLKAYALGITKRCALRSYRDRNAKKRGGSFSAESLSELERCLPSGENVENRADAKRLSAILNDWLGQLEASDRALFLKRYWFEESVSELAKTAGQPPMWVSSKLHSLRKKLKDQLEKEGFYV